ncbi:MAG TPA: phenylalanine--tRNA ligase subunit alpha [Terriglobales bacterium]|nr:phenylalanine--tRNA ligase subunit alpha [Terriglobales bacterium]
MPKLDDYSLPALDGLAGDLTSALKAESAAVRNEQEWKAFRDRWLSRKSGIVTQLNDLLKAAPKESKREVGQRVNQLRALIEEQVAAAGRQASAPGRAGDQLDITLPGIRRPLGAEHPIIRTMNEVVAVFKAMGYSVAEGPEIETDYFNFEALNFPPNHPARDTQDTLFIAGQERKPQRERLVLRTHTSPVQIRAMMASPPPLRIVCPGKVHRRDAADATHSPMFHQLECLAVDSNITFSDLKGTLDHMCKALFGSSVKTRFQPSFFPFTEPSAEVYVSCPFCGARGCRICKQSGWIELGGSGMVHPNVFEAVRGYGYDPAKISGFAFGMGIDRMAALRWDIHDIQLFFEGDVRFLEQFA